MRLGMVATNPTLECYKRKAFPVKHIEIDLTKVSLGQIRAAREVVRSSPLSTSLHIPWNYTVNISSENAKVDIAYVLSVLSLLDEIEGEYITLHLGYFKNGRDREKCIGNAIDSLNSILDAGHKTKVAIENLKPRSVISGNYFLGGDEEDFGRIFDEIKDERLVMCYDVGHAAFSWNLEETVERFRAKTYCMHIHDNDGKMDHLGIGEGHIDWRKFFQVARVQELRGPLILEVFGEKAKHSFEKLAKYVSELIVGQD